MGPTLNKDGTPRKIGSGKTKGAGCFAKIKWHQLREFISPDDEILVSRVWLREVGALNQRRGSKKKLITSLASSEKAKKSIPHPSSKKDKGIRLKIRQKILRAPNNRMMENIILQYSLALAVLSNTEVRHTSENLA